MPSVDKPRHNCCICCKVRCRLEGQLPIWKFPEGSSCRCLGRGFVHCLVKWPLRSACSPLHVSTMDKHKRHTDMITPARTSKKRHGRVRSASPQSVEGSSELENLVRSRMTVVDRNGQLRRWGNSPATHIAKRILIAAGVDENQPFDTLASNGVVTLVFHARKARKTRRSPYQKYTLDELLPEPMAPGQKESWPATSPRGKETW